MRHIYNVLWYLLLPLLPLRLLWRSRKNSAYRQRMRERFACFNTPQLTQSIWLHAVSVGEALAAVPLIKALHQNYPQLSLVVTTMTPTGAERIRQIFPEEIVQLYVPYDHPIVVKRFLAHIQPRILILMETELWPNILYYTAARKVPIVVANARLSTRSFKHYQKLMWLIKPLMQYLTIVMAQSELDAKRFIELGLKAAKVVTTGNLKFDSHIPQEIFVESNKLRSIIGTERPVWIAASTHDLEEEKILGAARSVLNSFPQALLILVPRHPERFEKVFALCKKLHFNPLRYSDIQNYTSLHNVIVGNVMGQLFLFYATSDVAFVGGSLVPWGGHNLLEAASLKKPIISGPHLHAFLAISHMLKEHKGLIIVHDKWQLAVQVVQLFTDSELRTRLGEAAYKVIEKNSGVTQRVLDTVNNILHESS